LLTAVLTTPEDHPVRFGQLLFRELIYRQVTNVRSSVTVGLRRAGTL
jgi:hypothetical protein